MLSFKSFITKYLTEATIKHFTHIGLDSANPEHQDLVAAYNQGHSQNDPGVPRNPNQIKSLEHLKDVVRSHLEEIQQNRIGEQKRKEAIESGHASIVHKDEDKGLTVYKVHSHEGMCAVGSNKWCTNDPSHGEKHLKKYDPEIKNTHVIHLDKEKGNLSRIGMVGVAPLDNDFSGNFQDKGNNPISDKDWNDVVQKYGLHKVKALEGIRGIPMPKETHEKNLHSSIDAFKRGESKQADLEKTYIAASNAGAITPDHLDKTPQAVLHNMIMHNHFSDDSIHHLATSNKTHSDIKKIIAYKATRHDTLHHLAGSNDFSVLNGVANNSAADSSILQKTKTSLNQFSPTYPWQNELRKEMHKKINTRLDVVERILNYLDEEEQQ